MSRSAPDLDTLAQQWKEDRAFYLKEIKKIRQDRIWWQSGGALRTFGGIFVSEKVDEEVFYRKRVKELDDLLEEWRPGEVAKLRNSDEEFYATNSVYSKQLTDFVEARFSKRLLLTLFLGALFVAWMFQPRGPDDDRPQGSRCERWQTDC